MGRKLSEGRATPGRRTVGGKDAGYVEPTVRGVLGYHIHKTKTDSECGRETCRRELGERGTSYRCAVDVLCL